ncbi:MAG: hypothetical protein JKX91_06410 [Rhizobiaceae bacterium]|nr:hypothetical protein [Rhizobiaceae bacterium]
MQTRLCKNIYCEFKKQRQPIENFSPVAKCADGLSRTCKSCLSRKSRAVRKAEKLKAAGAWKIAGNTLIIQSIKNELAKLKSRDANIKEIRSTGTEGASFAEDYASGCYKVVHTLEALLVSS